MSNTNNIAYVSANVDSFGANPGEMILAVSVCIFESDNATQVVCPAGYSLTVLTGCPEYIRSQVETQVRQINTNYAPLNFVWF